jgi:hypothetical protein
MSALKPQKQPRMMGQTQVTRSASVPPRPSPSSAVESDPPTTSTQSTAAAAAAAAAGITPPIAGTQNHPKGHKVRELEEVWKAMDGQTYLRLTDTIFLNDVYVQPTAVEVVAGAYVTVTFQQIVLAPNIKRRENAVAKMYIEDLMHVLHLNDVVQSTLQGIEPRDYESWLAEKTRSYIQTNGLRDSSNHSALANFIITYDKEFSFYPTVLQNCGVFFRKTCYHSYKEKKPAWQGSDGVKYKFVNPSMIKCSAKGGKFDYVYEARLVLLPSNWNEACFLDEVVGPSEEV